MLESNFRSMKTEKKDFPLIPADVYSVKLLDITSKIEESYNSKMGKTDNQEFSTTLTFKFELLDNGQVGQTMWSNYIPSELWVSPKTGKNKLFKILEALIGRELTPEEIMTGVGGDYYNSLIGRTCRVLVEHIQKNDKTYANITNWMKATSVSATNPEIKIEEIPF